jgi:hypothetical protein
MREKRKSRQGKTDVAAVKTTICARIAQGESLRAVCRDSAMPSMATVCRWLAEDATFVAAYNSARDQRADAIFEEMFAIADDGANDWMVKTYGDDQPAGWAFNGEHVQRSRLRIDTRKWALSRMNPKKYGDRVQTDHAGEVGLKVSIVQFGGKTAGKDDE